ncbi:MAG TPA: hypothetical protein PK867_27875 [Pirellulales bacterium]|nr:hypothetical protein [Pirellulales bacterium]
MARKRVNKQVPADPDLSSQPPSFASIYPGTPPNDAVADNYAISPVIADGVRRLEAEVGMPVWLLVQSNRLADRDDPCQSIDRYVVREFFHSRLSILREGEPIALVVYSPGGSARYAYELAMLLRRHCGGFVAVVPRYAKSAATLLTLGADEILMNVHAELGPLDAQIYDPEHQEEHRPALDEVQALEELSAFALRVFDEMMPRLIGGSDLRTSSLMPVAGEFVARLAAPLFDKIDVVRYTQVARQLKIGEEYAKRLLEKTYGPDAERISRWLTRQYPEHGFPIYSEELREIGLRIGTPTDAIRSILEEMTVYLRGETLIGRVITGD